MKKHQVISISNCWSSKRLTRSVEEKLDELSSLGWEVVTVSFGFNHWWVHTAYITVSKGDNFV